MGWFKKIKKKIKKVAKKALPVVAQAAGTYFGGPAGGALASSLVGGGGGGGGGGSFMPTGYGTGEGGFDWWKLGGDVLQSIGNQTGAGQQVPGFGGGQIQLPGGMNIPPQMMALLAGQMGGAQLPNQPDWMRLAELTAKSERDAGTRASYESHSNASNSQGSSQWIPEMVRDPATGQMVTQWKNQVTLDPTLKQTQDAQRGGDLMRQQAANGMLPGALGAMSQPMDYSQFGAAQGLGGNTGYDTGGGTGVGQAPSFGARPPPGMMNGGAAPGAGGLTSGMFGKVAQVQPKQPGGGGGAMGAAKVPGGAAAPKTSPLAPLPKPVPRPDPNAYLRQLSGFAH
jgi:hypothetical protein